MLTSTTASFPGHHPELGHSGSSLSQTLRASVRLLGFALLCIAEALEWIIFVRLSGRSRDRQTRAQWLSRFARRLAHLLQLRVEVHGQPPATGLLVANHLSYLDVIMLAMHQPMTFVAKSDTRRWPLLGILITWAGTLFVDREHRGDVARAGGELAKALAQRTPVCLFPEGTSSDGSRVLPFRSSLLAPAVQAGQLVTPCHLAYHLPDGDAAQEACYWGDMTFATHFFHLLGKPAIFGTIWYGESSPPGTDRKVLASRLHANVTQLPKADTESLQCA